MPLCRPMGQGLGVEIMSNRHIGSSLDDFLKEEGLFEESQALAIKEVVVWQLVEAMDGKATVDQSAPGHHA